MTRDGTATGLRAVRKRLVGSRHAACLRQSKSDPYPPGGSPRIPAPHSGAVLRGRTGQQPPQACNPGTRLALRASRRPSTDEQGSPSTPRLEAGHSTTHGASCQGIGAPRGSRPPGLLYQVDAMKGPPGIGSPQGHSYPAFWQGIAWMP